MFGWIDICILNNTLSLVCQKSLILCYTYGMCLSLALAPVWQACICTFLFHQINLYFSLPFIINTLFCREHVMPLRMHSPWDTSKTWGSNHHWNFSGPKNLVITDPRAAPGRKSLIRLVREAPFFILPKRTF